MKTKTLTTAVLAGILALLGLSVPAQTQVLEPIRIGNTTYWAQWEDDPNPASHRGWVRLYRLVDGGKQVNVREDYLPLYRGGPNVWFRGKETPPEEVVRVIVGEYNLHLKKAAGDDDSLTDVQKVFFPLFAQYVVEDGQWVKRGG